MQPAADTPVEDFESLFQGHPQDIERRMLALRAKAAGHPDITLAPRIETRIALAQAMLGRHEDSRRTFYLADGMRGSDQPSVRIQLQLTLGRLLHQENKPQDAYIVFVHAWKFACRHSMEGPAVDAAHLIANVVEKPATRVYWNQTALKLAQASTDPEARAWISVLYNNLAQSYIADSRFPAAQEAFTVCRQLALAENNSIVERGARWGIARALRSLGGTAEAMAVQHQLLSEYSELERSGALPIALIRMGRGLVHEELAHLSTTTGPELAARALEDLSCCRWVMCAATADRWVKLASMALQQPGFVFTSHICEGPDSLPAKEVDLNAFIVGLSIRYNLQCDEIPGLDVVQVR